MTLRPRHILAVLDPAAPGQTLTTAAALADRHDAQLSVLCVVEPPHDLSIAARMAGTGADVLLAGMTEQTRTAAAAIIADALPGRDARLSVTSGKAFIEIIRHVTAEGCDFVVKSAEPLSGLSRFLFASTDQHLLRKCPCPVWLQTPGAGPAPRRVIATVDLDTWDADEPETLTHLNTRVIDAACAIGGPDAEVAVLHAWDAVGEGMIWAFAGSGDARVNADRYVNEVMAARQDAMERFLARARTAHPDGPRLVPRLVRGTPETVIEGATRDPGADVVVMGTVARTGLSGVFIGNTAENIINSLACPVLAVKPDGFISPLHRG